MAVNVITTANPEIDPHKYLVTSYARPRGLTSGTHHITKSHERNAAARKNN
jgi:hypothetical protein